MTTLRNVRSKNTIESDFIIFYTQKYNCLIFFAKAKNRPDKQPVLWYNRRKKSMSQFEHLFGCACKMQRKGNTYEKTYSINTGSFFFSSFNCLPR